MGKQLQMQNKGGTSQAVHATPHLQPNPIGCRSSVAGPHSNRSCHLLLCAGASGTGLQKGEGQGVMSTTGEHAVAHDWSVVSAAADALVGSRVKGPVEKCKHRHIDTKFAVNCVMIAKDCCCVCRRQRVEKFRIVFLRHTSLER